MNKINAIYVSLLALIISVACAAMCMTKCNKAAPVAETSAPAAAPAAPAAPVAAMDVETIRTVLNNNPEIVFNAMQAYQIKQEEERQKAAAIKIKQNIKEITDYEGAAVVGNPNGSVTLVEFFDFSCGYCHRLYPALKNIVAKNSDVRLVLRELTFLGPVSDYAAKAALAAKEQGKYQELWSAMMENDGALSEAKIDELAAAAGIDVAKMKADMNSAKVTKTIQDTADLANSIEIRGVPTMILDGQILQTLDEGEIQRRIDAMKNK